MYMSEISKSKVSGLKAQKMIILLTLKHVSAISEHPVQLHPKASRDIPLQLVTYLVIIQVHYWNIRSVEIVLPVLVSISSSSSLLSLDESWMSSVTIGIS